MSEPTTPVAEAARHTIDATMAKIGTGVTTTSGVTSVVGGLTLNDTAIIVGMVGVVAGLVIQWYYRHKLTMVEIRLKEEQAKRDHEAHIARMEMYR